MEKYITLDLETTGLNPKKDRIIEIGAVKVCSGVVIEEYTALINPQMEIPQRITEITGITDEMVKGKPMLQEVLEQFLEFCEDLPLLGHNILFDYRFMKHKAVQEGMVFEKMGVDTLKLARTLLSELPSKSLQSLREYYQFPQEEAHRALEDARTTYRLYEKLRSIFEEANPGLFVPAALVCQVKRQGPITAAQKRYLQDLVKYHKINLNMEIDSLTKSEASQQIDRILSTYGKINV